MKPQPSAIIKWWGPYDRLARVNDDVVIHFNDGQHLLCLTLSHEADEDTDTEYRHLISWERLTIEAHDHVPTASYRHRGDEFSYYLGQIVSAYANLTRPAAHWALLQRLLPKGMPSPHPPYWPSHYCVAVTSWFYTAPIDRGSVQVPPPHGFPHVVTYHG